MSGKKYDTFLSKITINNSNAITDMINVNIVGNINILAGCLPKMIEKKWNYIILLILLLKMNIFVEQI